MSCFEEFKKLLAQLKTNNKADINRLTELANNDTAKKEPQKIVAMFSKVRGLFFLYVLDSISKNIGDPYLKFIEKRIVSLFKETFVTTLEPELRKKMFDLRHTWTGVFSLSTLDSIDFAINKIDTAWPITVANAAPILLVDLHNYFEKWKIPELQLLLEKLCKNKAKTVAQSKKSDFIENICTNPLVSVPYTNNELKMMIEHETKKSPRNEAKDVLENKMKLLFSSFENVKRRAFPNQSEWLNYVYQVARWTKYNLEKMNDPIGNQWQFLSLRDRVAKALEEKNCSNLELFRQEYDSLPKNPAFDHQEINTVLMRLQKFSRNIERVDSEQSSRGAATVKKKQSTRI